MNIPKFKVIKQKLSFFKVYSSLLVPVVIGLVAVFLLVFTPLMGSSLRENIEKESISGGGKKVKLLSKKVPPAEQWKIEQKYQQNYESDANQIALLAKQSTQRELLSYKVFPEPKDTSTLIFEEFSRQFCEKVDGLIARINGRDCPTAAELERSLQQRRGLSLRSPAIRSGSSARVMSLGKLSDVDTTIKDILCLAKAKSASVYANPIDLSGYEFWKEYKFRGAPEAVNNCWYWQLGYWIIEDVVGTIGSLNSASDSVLTSPVKRLLAVRFYGGSGRSSGGGLRPHYVLSSGGGLANSLTRRHSGDDIDIVHFNVVVLVSTKAVFPFMQQLCSVKQHKFRGFFGEAQEQLLKHNQITILESSINSIDWEDTEHDLYRYGEDAVVELDLTCEYMFNKSGYDKIKPESVKEELLTTGRRARGRR